MFGSLDLLGEPLRLIRRLAEIQGERDAAEKLAQLRHRALADGLELGREFVPDPKDPPNKSKAHYKLTGFVDEVQALEERAAPWVDWQKLRRRSRRKQNDAQWQQVYEAMGVKT